jgi:SAM-dependent methyltransferase
MDSQFLATRRAFDSVAADYDGPQGNNVLIQKMRTQVMETIEQTFPRGARLIDLGCGTGIDAAYLAARGYSVTAIDASPAMVASADERLRQARLDTHVLNIGIHELAQLDIGMFDGAYSNFGALNCLPELRSVSAALGAKLRPGSKLVAAVIGRYCPWELVFYLMRGQPKRARVRFVQGMVPVPLNGERVWTRYLAPREFAREFAAEFEPVHQHALALFGPPPYLVHHYDRFRRLFDLLGQADRALGDKPILRNAGDHFLMVLRKR